MNMTIASSIVLNLILEHDHVAVAEATRGHASGNMMCPGTQANADLMRDPEVNVQVIETTDGV
jgi:hypothetical protein